VPSASGEMDGSQLMDGAPQRLGLRYRWDAVRPLPVWQAARGHGVRREDGVRQRWALAAAAATGVQVGAAMVASRYVVHEAGPATLTFVRYVVAVLLISPWLLRMKRPRFGVRDFWALAGLGVLQFGVQIALLNVGLAFLPAVRASVLFNTFPLMTMLIAAVLGREKLTAAKCLGALLAFLGVAATFGDAVLAGVSAREWPGVLAVLAAATVGALATVLTRPYVPRHGTLAVGGLAMAATVVAMLPPALAEGMIATLPALGATGWAALVFIGMSSGVGYMLWLTALRHASASHATLFLSLSPPTAVLLGVALLGEPFTLWLAIGLALVVAGLAVAVLGGQRASRA
jgi:drug/metabolite transporter (DMT)-like permease